MTTKMTTKRIVTIAVVGVLVLIAAAVIIITQRPGIDLKELPPDWKKVQDVRQEGVLGVVYQGTGTLQDSLAVFKSSLEKAGWSHVRDSVQENIHYATFRKGNQQAVALVMGGGPNIVVHVLVSEAPPEEVKKLELPGQDVAGEDIKDIPRYPNALRTSYETAPRELHLEYLVLADIDKVIDFYTSQLPANGWMLQAMASDKESTEIVGTKTGKTESAIATIIIRADEVFTGYTGIEITVLIVK